MPSRRSCPRHRLQSRKNHLILVGEPGVGKTGIVEGFAQLLAEGKLPESLEMPAVIEISLPSLVGRKGRFLGRIFGISPSWDKCGGHRRAATGEFVKRREAVAREAPQEPKPILFIVEIHLLLGSGQASGSMDAANILKPALARGAIRVIGAPTIREYRQSIEKDGARVGRDRRARPLIRPHGRCDCVEYGAEEERRCSLACTFTFHPRGQLGRGAAARPYRSCCCGRNYLSGVAGVATPK